jgi:hypothetical protein
LALILSSLSKKRNNKGLEMSNISNSEAGHLTLSNLEATIKYLPGQTETFTKMLAAFCENQEDITGFRVDNLRVMAQSLKMSYETIDGLLATFDKFEKHKEAGE